jgi:gas vesicle protein
MTDRNEIQRSLERKLDAGEATLAKMKAKMAEAGDDASDEMAHAVKAAERTLEKGRHKLNQMTAATDEEFEEMWSDAKDAWHDLSTNVESGWQKVSDRVKSFFA